MNFDPLGEAELSKFAFHTVAPNALDKLALSVELLHFMITGYINVIITVNGNVTWTETVLVQIPWTQWH